MSEPAEDVSETVLRLAREAAASVWEGGAHDMPGVLEGRFDGSLGVRIAVRAILHAHGPLLERVKMAEAKSTQAHSFLARLIRR